MEEDGTGAFYSSNTFGADGLVSRFPGESLDIVRLDGSGGSDSSVFYTFDERGNVSERVNTASVSGGPKGPAVSGTSGSSLSAVSEVYDAFGSRTAQSPQPEPWGYEAQAGYYTDSETGLILCTHRYYDPSTGRWLTRDPLGYGGGVNLYGYVGNDPGNRWDPLGYTTYGITINVGISFGPVSVGVSVGGKGDSNGTGGVSGSIWGTARWPPSVPGPGVSVGVSTTPGNLPVDQNGITSVSGGASFGPVVYVPPFTAIQSNTGTKTLIIPITACGNTIPGVPGVGILGSLGGTIGVNGPGIDDVANKGIDNMYHPVLAPL